MTMNRLAATLAAFALTPALGHPLDGLTAAEMLRAAGIAARR